MRRCSRQRFRRSAGLRRGALGLLRLVVAGWVAGWALLVIVAAGDRALALLAAGRPAAGPEWVATGERFVDPETGKLVTVYYHPATGERRYIAPPPK